MNKQYQKPEMKMVCIQHQGIICNSKSPVSKTSNNAGFNENIIGGSGTARSRQHGVWDGEDDWDE